MEKFRLNFSRYTNCDIAPLNSISDSYKFINNNDLVCNESQTFQEISAIIKI